MNARVGSYLLLSAVASVTSGCAGVTGDDYTLVANPPGLKYVSPTISQEELDRAFFERYQWTYRPGGWPAADLMFARIKDIYRGSRSYVKTKTLPERIDSYFPTRNIILGTRGTTRNVLGNVEYQHFSIDTVAVCIIIEQGIDRYADQVTLQSGAEPLGDMIVRGWYCAKATETDKQALFREFVDNIGIQGYAVPDAM